MSNRTCAVLEDGLEVTTFLAICAELKSDTPVDVVWSKKAARSYDKIIFYGLDEQRRKSMREYFGSGVELEFKKTPDGSRLRELFGDSSAPVTSKPQVVEIADALTKHSQKRYQTRAVQFVRTLVIHHSAVTPEAGPERLAAYHVRSRKWPGIGYHFVVMADGTIYQTNKLETISYQSAGKNDISVGICLAGNFQEIKPPKEQLDAARALVAWLKKELPAVTAVKPHRLMEGSSTACPGNTWNEWFSYVAGDV